MVLTEGWCGDAAQVLPVINKIASLSDFIDLKIILRDEHEELMNKFLTNGSKSIPKLVAIDENKKGDLFLGTKTLNCHQNGRRL